MNTEEARGFLREGLAVYEGKTYAELVSLMDEEFHFEMQGAGGVQYQVEIMIMWDSVPNGAILVIGSIDDGGWWAFVPLTESILKTPD